MKLIVVTLWFTLTACDGGCDSDNVRACAYACREQNERMAEWSKGRCVCAPRNDRPKEGD